jgi:hypothetical protein
MRSRIRGPTTGGIPRLNDIVKRSSDANDNSSRSTGHRRIVVVASTKVECDFTGMNRRFGELQRRHQPKYWKSFQNSGQLSRRPRQT